MSTASDTANAKALYFADSPPTVVRLDIKLHFEALTERQKRYAHYISRASWLGARAALRQVSPESEPIYDFILALYQATRGNWKALGERTGVKGEDVTTFLDYAAQFLGNGGNYKGFGDSKFIPRVGAEVLEKLASLSKETENAYQKAATTGGGFYETSESGKMHLGYTDAGHMTTYYPDSPTITKAEIAAISDFMEKKDLLPENTRLRKNSDGNFDLLIASGISNPPAQDRDVKADILDLDGPLSGKTLRLVYGDHINEMAKVALSLKKASLNAENGLQKKMMEQYVDSFGTGSLHAFKESQRSWVQDKGPTVESNIGFVETYRDPHGVRAEWEGLVAMVNKERTRAFGQLVSNAPKFIPKLPWSAEFEKDKFLSPDFTSLEVLTFSGSGVPSGINIPNYDDIRQNIGFKNVSLGNVISAKAPNEPIAFIRPEDDEIFRKYRDSAWEVQVGLHELLGHGSGKHLQETSPGVYNFDIKNPPISPLTGKPITTWYKPGQTWSSIFGSISSSYEECRAECVAMALSCEFEALKLFGFGDGKVDMDGEAGDVLFVSYLQMARAGIASLEFWDPKSKKWGQAHMQARFSILRTFLSAGSDFVRLVPTSSSPITGRPSLAIHLDRSKILTHGRPAVDAYLQKLQIYKSTADLDAGKKLYEDMTTVDEYFATEVRRIVMENRTPRKVFVQANTFLSGEGEDEEGGKVELREYEASPEGMVRSFAERDI